MNQITEIVEAVKSVLPSRRPIEHHEPFQTNFLNWNADSLKLFEEKLRHVTGAEHVITTSSGTAALHTVFLAAGIRPGEEVIVPTNTFVGTANAVVHAGAIPHFLDGGLTLSPFKLRQYLANHTEKTDDRRGRKNRHTGNLITAIVPVHLFGLPASIVDFVNVATDFGLLVVEDSAQALGTKVNGRHVGTFGMAGILSFNNNKIVTTNGGGAILTNTAELAEKARSLVSTARVPHPWLIEHTEVAYNYRMGNINAAYGLTQLEHLDEILDRKTRLADSFRAAFSEITSVNFIRSNCPDPFVQNNWLISIQINPFRFEDQIQVGEVHKVGKVFRDKILQALHAEGIKARASFSPLHTLPMYVNNPRNAHFMIESEHFFSETICLPSGPNLI